MERQIAQDEVGDVDGSDEALRIDRYLDAESNTLPEDVRAGLGGDPKSLPPKYFYDDRGSELFDRICDLPEYYPTRTEHELLHRLGPGIIQAAGPRRLIELGSGTSRKTRALLDPFVETAPDPEYVPMDVSEGVLWSTAQALHVEYPSLRIHAIVGDYEHHLERIPPGGPRLVLFLGGTIGNFTAEESRRFLGALRQALEVGDFFLLGMDLVKPVPVLEAAYNDSRGVTAEFNRNVLAVLNRELGATFHPEWFEHRAVFNRDERQIEMYLHATRAHRVRIPGVDMEVSFRAGEPILTEISRKFVREDAVRMMHDAGMELAQWLTSPNDFFALALGRVI